MGTIIILLAMLELILFVEIEGELHKAVIKNWKEKNYISFIEDIIFIIGVWAILLQGFIPKT